MTKREKRVLEEIREAQRRLEPRVADDVKRSVEKLADLYDADLRKLAAYCSTCDSAHYLADGSDCPDCE